MSVTKLDNKRRISIVPAADATMIQLLAGGK